MYIEFVSCNFTEFFTLFCFLVEFLGFVCNIIWNRQFYFCLFNLDAFYFFSFSCLITLARTSNTMLNKRCESGHLYLFIDHKRKPLSFSLSLSYYVEICSFYTYFVKHFYYKLMLNFVKHFCYIYWSDHTICTLHFVNVTYHIDWFVDNEPSLHPQDKSHLIMVDDPFNVLLNLIY